jgi:hypothetical protein
MTLTYCPRDKIIDFITENEEGAFVLLCVQNVPFGVGSFLVGVGDVLFGVANIMFCLSNVPFLCSGYNIWYSMCRRVRTFFVENVILA